ncbi:MAG: hypothetical protein IK000_02200 [Bacteroidaceae bacterium]|nr:hypothetical protein [Bacteroidaceae bacterium]
MKKEKERSSKETGFFFLQKIFSRTDGAARAKQSLLKLCRVEKEEELMHLAQGKKVFSFYIRRDSFFIRIFPFFIIFKNTYCDRKGKGERGIKGVGRKREEEEGERNSESQKKAQGEATPVKREKSQKADRRENEDGSALLALPSLSCAALSSINFSD